MAGQIVILNGAPRSGKTSIAAALQARGPETWINLGVDAVGATLPKALWPGIGLRPGGERPDIEAHLPALFAALYDSVAAHAREGFNVVGDIGHHDGYSRALNLLPQCARRLRGLPVLFVGVRCSIEDIMARRNAGAAAGQTQYAAGSADDPIPAPVRLWQEAVHAGKRYDIEVDTSRHSAKACAEVIALTLVTFDFKTSAFVQLAKQT